MSLNFFQDDFPISISILIPTFKINLGPYGSIC